MSDNEKPSTIPAEVIDAARTKHGEVTEITAAGETVLARRPTRGEYKRFRAESLSDVKRADAVEHLCRSCIVHPDASGFDAMLERKPALADIFGAKVLELAGAVGEAEARKL